MKAATTSFEKVSEVKRYKDWIDGPTVCFRFSPPGRTEREVTIRADPTLRDGMHVIAVLRDKDDWSTLVAWKDLETGSIVAKNQKVAVKSLVIRFSLVGILLVAWAMGVYFPFLFYPLILCLSSLWQSFQEWRYSCMAWKMLDNTWTKSEA